MIDKVKGRLFDPRTNRKMAWVHFTERQRTTSILSTIAEHNASVGPELQIRLSGTNTDEDIITSVGRKRLQSHPYYKEIMKEDDTYWEVNGEELDDSPRELKKLKFDHVVNVQPVSLKRASIKVVPFEPPQPKQKRARVSGPPVKKAVHGKEALTEDDSQVEAAPQAVNLPPQAVNLPEAVPAQAVNLPQAVPAQVEEAPLPADVLRDAASYIVQAMHDTFASSLASKDETIAAKEQVIRGHATILEGRGDTIAAMKDTITSMKDTIAAQAALIKNLTKA